MICRTKLSSVLLVVSLIHQTAYASFCGHAALPFSFESLPDGQPVLGCARPKCFGWNAEGKPAGSPSTFFRINNKPDGYFRKSAENLPKHISAEDAQFFQPQIATCSSTFDSEHCNSENQFIGGIGPMVNVSGLPMAVQCCEYEPLRNSSDRGIAVVNAGQIVIGGEILNGERQYAFDYISDVSKHTKSDGSVSYEVAVRRLSCIPHPNEFTVNVDQPVIDEVLTRFGKIDKHPKANAAQAFQAPTQTVSEQAELQEIGTSEQTVNVGQQQPAPPSQGQIISQTDEVVLSPTGQEQVQVVRGPFVAEPDAIVEEVEAIQGFELPEGQVPQGLIEPQPAAQPGYGYAAQPGYGYAAQPAYSGGYGSGGGGGGGSMFCFSADTNVRLSNGKTKRMDELSINDWVLSANRSQMVYANIESWLHKMPQVKADFHRIELTDGKVLKITSKHYIYKTECSNENNLVPFEKINQVPVYAEKVQVGDCLYVLSDKQEHTFEQRRVEKIEIVEETGIFAPMTSNGDIIVNDIYSSCFNILNNRVMQYSFIENIKALPSLGWIFGENNDEEQMTELPYGTSLIVDLMEYVLPVSIYSV